MPRLVEEFLSQLEVRINDGDQAGFCKHLKGMDPRGRYRAALSISTMQTEDRSLRGMGLVYIFAIGGYYSGSALCSIRSRQCSARTYSKEFKVWPPCTLSLLGDLQSHFFRQKLVEKTIKKSMSNRRGVGPDDLRAELLKIVLYKDRGDYPRRIL